MVFLLPDLQVLYLQPVLSDTLEKEQRACLSDANGYTDIFLVSFPVDCKSILLSASFLIMEQKFDFVSVMKNSCSMERLVAPLNCSSSQCSFNS